MAGRHPKDILWVRRKDLLSPRAQNPGLRSLSPLPTPASRIQATVSSVLTFIFLWLQNVNNCLFLHCLFLQQAFLLHANGSSGRVQGKAPDAAESETLGENLLVCWLPAVGPGRPGPGEVGLGTGAHLCNPRYTAGSREGHRRDPKWGCLV